MNFKKGNPLRKPRTIANRITRGEAFFIGAEIFSASVLGEMTFHKVMDLASGGDLFEAIPEMK